MHPLRKCKYLVLLIACCVAVVAGNPHSTTSYPFFEGWFIRLTTQSGGSIGFAIGHLPNQHPENPNAACFLLQQDSTADSSPPQIHTLYLSSLDVAPGKQQPTCFDCPAFTASGSSAAGSCNLEVSGALVNIHVDIKGAVKFDASNDATTASVLPWGQFPGTSPEGWLPEGILRLHWYVYSMNTPLSYTLTTNNQHHHHHQQQQQQGAEDLRMEASRVETVGLPTAAAVAGSSGVGWAHLEKNWGAAFPDQWVWAQGGSRGGKSSFALAGGALPTKQTLTTTTAPSSSSSSSSSDLGQRPTAVAFSYHSPDLNITADPWNPAWVTAFDVCGCCSSVHITLQSFSHTIAIHVAAERGSFSGVPCPTEDGFKVMSDQSFSATARVRVYGSSAGSSTSPHISRLASTTQHRKHMAHTAASSSSSSIDSGPSSGGSSSNGIGSGGDNMLLISVGTFESAGLEFGGSLRCAEHTSIT